MKLVMKSVALLLVGFAITARPAICEGENAGGKKLWAKSYLGKPAPNITVEQWLTAKPDVRGKFVLVDFWATWCPPCRKAVGELNGYQRKFAGRLVCIGLSDEPAATVRAFKSPQPTYSMAIDTKATTKNLVQVTGVPHVMIIDPRGIVRWEGFPYLGGQELTETVIADIIRKYS